MSLTPKNEASISPISTQNVMHCPQTPLDHYSLFRGREIVTPEHLFHTVGSTFEDLFCPSTFNDTFTCHPRKDSGTPLMDAHLFRPSHEIFGSTPTRNSQNHFEKTPLNLSHLPNIKHVSYHQKLDFSEENAASQEELKYEETTEHSRSSLTKGFHHYSKAPIDNEVKEEMESDEEEVNEKKGRSKKNSTKGLRNLSVAVAEIVRELRNVTYKDVANKLIVKLIEEGKIPPKHNVRFS